MRIICFFLVVLLVGCVSTNNILTSLEYSTDDNYGYVKENPILIGEKYHWHKNTELAYLFLSKLTYNGKSLQFLGHATVYKPLNQPRKRRSISSDLFTPASLGATTLDLFIMQPRGTSDTLNLYFDVEIKGTLKIPKGFEFDINQENNVYQ